MFEGVRLRYRAGLPCSLVGATLCRRRRPCGGVGCSGAGKSTLLTLFRLTEACGGRVLVDGVDVASVGLQLLRRRLR